MGPWKTFPVYNFFLLFYFICAVHAVSHFARVINGQLQKTSRLEKLHPNKRERGGRQRQRRRWWHVVDGLLKQPVTRESKGRRYGTLAACLPAWVAVYHGCRINETTHVKDATGDQEQMPCDLHATVAAGATAASESVV